MSNSFSSFGNVGAAPTLRRVPVDGEQRAVADLRVYFDRRIHKGDGRFEDEGGFWLTVSVWGTRAENVARLIQKGARVHVVGVLRQETWNDRETGQPRSEMRLAIERQGSIALDLMCLESVAYRPKRGTGGGGGSGPAGAEGGEDDFPDEDIPF